LCDYIGCAGENPTARRFLVERDSIVVHWAGTQSRLESFVQGHPLPVVRTDTHGERRYLTTIQLNPNFVAWFDPHGSCVASLRITSLENHGKARFAFDSNDIWDWSIRCEYLLIGFTAVYHHQKRDSRCGDARECAPAKSRPKGPVHWLRSVQFSSNGWTVNERLGRFSRYKGSVFGFELCNVTRTELALRNVVRKWSWRTFYKPLIEFESTGAVTHSCSEIDAGAFSAR
jgi:hypothetical protein